LLIFLDCKRNGKIRYAKRGDLRRKLQKIGQRKGLGNDVGRVYGASLDIDSFLRIIPIFSSNIFKLQIKTKNLNLNKINFK